MRRLLFAASLLVATPALADDGPNTLILPTPLMNKIYQYIIQRPYYEVASLAAELQACNAAQIVDANGAYSAEAQKACPAVISFVPMHPKSAPTVK